MNNCKLFSRRTLVFIFLLSAIATGCEKESTPLKLPTINSSEIFTLSSNAITIKSTFDFTKADSVTNLGICWSLQPNPTIHNNFTASSLEDSIMYSRITGLTPKTNYYARIYARNSEMELYGDEIEFTTNNTLTDIEGNVYNTVSIGTQTWIAENLKGTKYNDGTDIPIITGGWSDHEPPSYCWYDFNVANKDITGALYNWPAVASEKMCPVGWHVPTNEEWIILTDYVGGENNAGSFLKATGNSWDTPNSGATNYAGFTSLPGGSSASVVGYFTLKGMKGIWWSSTVDYSYDEEGRIIIWSMSYNSSRVDSYGLLSRGGPFNFLSIRCIKD